MNCPICGANMTEFEKKTFDNRCSDCYSDVWAAENIGEKQSIEQVENMIKIFKNMKRKEPDKYIKASYDYAIKSYEKQLENLSSEKIYWESGDEIMLKAYKYRIYPTSEQRLYLNKTFGCTRFIYNQMLADRIKSYEKIE